IIAALDEGVPAPEGNVSFGNLCGEDGPAPKIRGVAENSGAAVAEEKAMDHAAHRSPKVHPAGVIDAVVDAQRVARLVGQAERKGVPPARPKIRDRIKH